MTTPWRRCLAAVLAAVAAAACTTADPEPAATAPEPSPSTDAAGPAPASSAPREPTEVLATGLSVPWGVAFLPDGTALVTERARARVLRVPTDGADPSTLAEIAGVDANGEGGLLGIAVSPDYAADRMVYLYYSTDDDNRIVRFREPAAGAEPQLEVMLDGIPVNRNHNGGRLAFGPDGMLYATTGDAGQPARSQDRTSLAGKILRLSADGSVPADNPFPGSPVYSVGHRNVQGLDWDDEGRLWATEFGQNRLDEINVIEPGGNYGWPEAEGAEGGGQYRDPVTTWPTDDASPSGASVVDGSLWVAALRGERLWQVPLDRPTEPREHLRGEFGRLRHAARAPDGSLWLLTSNRDGRGDPAADDDRIIRVETAAL